jgi:hypothetical protein
MSTMKLHDINTLSQERGASFFTKIRLRLAGVRRQFIRFEDVNIKAIK